MNICNELKDLKDNLSSISKDITLFNNPVLKVSKKLDEIIINFYNEESNKYQQHVK